MVAEFWQDLRYSARMLVKNSGFSLIAIIMLAVGIGANTAVFSIGGATVGEGAFLPEEDRATGTNPLVEARSQQI